VFLAYFRAPLFKLFFAFIGLSASLKTDQCNIAN